MIEDTRKGTIETPGGTLAVHNHDQADAAAEWIINHGLGFRPEVTTFSVGGVRIYGGVSHPSLNQARVTFLEPLAGSARCS